jgi:hypothetical protein
VAGTVASHRHASACGISLFKAVLGDMALLLAVEAASFGKQLLPFVFVHCVNFGCVNIHHIRIFSGLEASTALLSPEGLAPALVPIVFEAKGAFNFSPQFMLVMCGILPFNHGDRSWLDFFKYGMVKWRGQPFAEQDGHSLHVWLPPGFKTEMVKLSNVPIKISILHLEGHQFVLCILCPGRICECPLEVPFEGVPEFFVVLVDGGVATGGHCQHLIHGSFHPVINIQALDVA